MLPSKHQVLDFPPGNRNKKEVSVLNRATMPRDDDAPPGRQGKPSSPLVASLRLPSGHSSVLIRTLSPLKFDRTVSRRDGGLRVQSLHWGPLLRHQLRRPAEA
eukprot:1156931-Pelagomonas_calceolata.AAC.10